MHGNDEHDPLDSWLGQQVRPLPPPPGTFELIKARARRRKIRKLAVTVASAAALGVAVAVAVPGGLLLRVGPSPATSGLAVGQTHPAGGPQSHQANGTGTLYKSPSPTPSSPTPTQSDLTEAVGPVPANFQPSSVTFVDTDHAWVIGQAGTPGHCADANPDFCTSIVRTDNTGKTWHGGPAPKTGPPSGAAGVSGIRFLDGVNGWAFGPELWVTHNSGNSWYQLPTLGQRVTDLETAGDRAFAVFAMCTSPSGGYTAGCTRFTLMTTTKDSDNWTPVGAPTNGLTNGGVASSATIALTSTTGYLLAPDGSLFSGPLDGTWQKIGTAPCQPGNGTSSVGMLALVRSALPAVACSSPSGTQVYTSTDSGAIWTPGPALSSHGMVASFTAAPNGTLVVATAASTE